jgi:signal transduction histidine kinase
MIVSWLTVLVNSTLLLRRRFPVAVFATQWMWSLIPFARSLDYMIPLVPSVGLLVALYEVGRRVRTTPSIALLGLSCAIASLIAIFVLFYLPSQHRHGLFHANHLVHASLSAAWLAVAAPVWAAGRRTYTAHRRAVLLKEAQVREAAEAVRAERLRLARELHDIVAHAVTAVVLQAAGVRTLVGRQDDRVRDALLVIESAGGQAMKELHRLLGLLRSVDPEAGEGDATTQPGLRDVSALVAQARTAGLDVEATDEGQPVELDRSVDLAAFRVVQEALTNAAKHGGPGGRVRLHQMWGDDRLTLTAQSTSRPVRAPVAIPSSGLGLRGLRERIALVGGRLDVGPDGDGFLLRAELPLSAARIIFDHGDSAQ